MEIDIYDPQSTMHRAVRKIDERLDYIYVVQGGATLVKLLLSAEVTDRGKWPAIELK